MKVLFAVNSESISDSIIKKYQKDYREILSYKNVYYFNAIQKEIQKDKSYDRIVISVDLEPFSTNNYESIDKFLFEKLDGISDEAHDTNGNEISIILICSDRHAKGSSFLVKLFGIGVYNALLGNDRSMEEVCRLINKPRTKKEAKMYYKIDTDDVNYRAENEDEVDEMQIQNILSHFRKLGKHTEKYAASFENIAAQYNEEQLKIVINCLPNNVKRVLEETSEKYQEIMAASGVMVQGIRNNVLETQEDQKRTGLKIDIIENKMSQTKMNGPIVIPNSVKKSKSTTAKNVIAVPQAGQTTKIKKAETPKVEKTVVHKAEEKVMEEKQMIEEPVKKEKVKVKIVRLPDGRVVKKKVVPKKKVVNEEEQQQPKTVKPERKLSHVVEEKETKTELDDIELPDLDMVNEIAQNAETVEPEVVIETTKKKRGRPRKNPVNVELEEKPKGKRGRPRKIEPISLEEEELPDLETITPDQLDMDFIDDNSLDELEMNKIEQQPENMEKEETLDILEENESDEMDLSALDDLDDLDDDFDVVTEEAFDEFDDYDEYGQYETSVKAGGKPEKNIEELYEEDILSDELEDDVSDDENILSDLDDLSEDDEAEDIFDEEDEADDDVLVDEIIDEDETINSEADDLISALDEENSDDTLEELDDDDDNNEMLSDFEDDDDLMSVVDSDDTIDMSYSMPNDMGTDNDFDTDNSLESIASSIDYSMSNLNSLMTKDKKIVTFIGSSKNGVSFLINNLAEIFASVGINTAILDMTKNRNSYYIYTQNEESLRQIAYSSIDKLQKGVADGIKVKQNLTVYTTLPNDGKVYPNVEEILSTLVQNHSLVLIDCDFETNPAYFSSSQEIYLVQSMDILTIQPLTAFLRDLKTQGAFEPEKVRVVINKEMKVRGLTAKNIIGGMSSYNDPAMSFMTELFDKEVVKYCSIPFEEIAYAKYLEGMLNCKISISGYSKNFMNKLRMLGDMVYPLTSRQTYSPNQGEPVSRNSFSSSMNDTLSKMRKKF